MRRREANKITNITLGKGERMMRAIIRRLRINTRTDTNHETITTHANTNPIETLGDLWQGYANHMTTTSSQASTTTAAEIKGATITVAMHKHAPHENPPQHQLEPETQKAPRALITYTHIHNSTLIEELFVAIAHRRNGHALKLITQVADETPHRTLHLVVDKTDRAAIKLYHKLGFRNIARSREHAFPHLNVSATQRIMKAYTNNVRWHTCRHKANPLTTTTTDATRENIRKMNGLHREIIHHHKQSGTSEIQTNANLTTADHMTTVTDSPTNTPPTHEHTPDPNITRQAYPVNIPHATIVPNIDTRMLMCETLKSLNRTIPPKRTLDMTHNMTDAQLTGKIARVQRRQGAKRKHTEEPDATDENNKIIMEHGKPAQRRKMTYRWRKSDLDEYLVTLADK